MDKITKQAMRVQDEQESGKRINQYISGIVNYYNVVVLYGVNRKCQRECYAFKSRYDV